MKNYNTHNLRMALVCLAVLAFTIWLWVFCYGCTALRDFTPSMTEAREEAATLSSAWFQGIPDRWTGRGVRCFTVPDIFV